MIVWLLSVSSALSLASLFATATSTPPHPRGRVCGLRDRAGRVPGGGAAAERCGDADAGRCVDAGRSVVPDAAGGVAAADAGRHRLLSVPAAQHEPGAGRAGHGVRHPPCAARRRPRARAPARLPVRDRQPAAGLCLRLQPDGDLHAVARASSRPRARCSSARSRGTAPPVCRCRRSGSAAWCRTSSIRSRTRRSTRSTTCCCTSSTRRGCRGTTWWTRWCRAQGSGPALSTNRAVKDFRFCEMVGDIRVAAGTDLGRRTAGVHLGPGAGRPHLGHHPRRRRAGGPAIRTPGSIRRMRRG